MLSKFEVKVWVDMVLVSDRDQTYFWRLARPHLWEEGKVASYKGEANSNLTGMKEFVQIKTKDIEQPEGDKTNTAGGEGPFP